MYLFFELIIKSERKERDNKFFKNKLKNIIFKRIFNISLFELFLKKINFFQINSVLTLRRFNILFIASVENFLTFINNLSNSFSAFKYFFYFYIF